MKTTKLTLMILSICIFAMSCKNGNKWGIRGKGGDVKEMQSVSNFDGINLKIAADVVYTHDSIYFVEITAQENILAVLETTVTNGDLVLDTKRELWNRNTIKVIVHSPEMKRISIGGSGKVDVNSKLTSSNLRLSIDGSGDINVNSVELQSINVSIDGSGNINVNGGTSNNASLNIDGSGNVDMSSVVTNTADVDINGSGNVSVKVTDKLNVDISGSGNVSYSGSPVVTKDIDGSGGVSHLD